MYKYVLNVFKMYDNILKLTLTLKDWKIWAN